MSVMITSLLTFASFVPAVEPPPQQVPPQRNPSPRSQPQPPPTRNPATPKPTDRRHGRGTKRGFPEEEGSSPDSPREPEPDRKSKPEEKPSRRPVPAAPEFDRDDPALFGRQLIEYLQETDAGWMNELGSGTIFHEGPEDRWRAAFLWKAHERPDRGSQRLLRVAGVEGGPRGGMMIQARPRFPATIWYTEAPDDDIRRLESAQKSRRFLGSLLECNDLAPIEANRFEWQYLGEASLGRDGDTLTCFRVEARHKVSVEDEDRRVYWISPEHWRIERIETSADGARSKRVFDFMSWHRERNRFWRPWRWVIRDSERAERTIVAFGHLQLFDHGDRSLDHLLAPTELAWD